MPDFLQAVAVFLCLLIIAGDLYERRVRNAWLIASLILGIGWFSWVWVQHTAAPLIVALIGLSVGLFLLLPFYALGWMGAGDVKFFATLGFLLGGKALLPIWIIASVLGGVHAVIILMSRFLIRHSGSGLSDLQAQVIDSPLWQRLLLARNGRSGLPYAAYMAVAALLTLKFTTLTHW